jgi:hypothetical protein
MSSGISKAAIANDRGVTDALRATAFGPSPTDVEPFSVELTFVAIEGNQSFANAR